MTKDEAISLEIEGLEETERRLTLHGFDRLERITAALAALRTATDWQPISDRHKHGKAWLLFDRNSGFYRTGRWYNRAWLLLGTIDNFYASDYFTHAMPMPAPPKEAE